MGGGEGGPNVIIFLDFSEEGMGGGGGGGEGRLNYL